MAENNILNNWIKQFDEDLSKSPLLNIDLDSDSNIRVMEDDFIILFNNLINGKTYKIANITKSEFPIIQSINNYRANGKNAEFETFTDLFEEDQNKILSSLSLESNECIKKTCVGTTYLCFGILRYSLDSFEHETCKAPLVLLPINVTFSEETGNYYISCSSSEIILNDALIKKLKDSRRVDLSYDVDSSFTISDYIYYVSIKVRPLNWSVINYNVITSLNLFSFYSLEDVKKNKEKIADRDVIKKISYLNSEFLQFNKSKGAPLDSKFLSVLEMDNDEYNVLKRVVNKEPLFIRPTSEASRNHVASNIILSYLLNNQKILVVYSDKNDKTSVTNYISTQGFDKFTLDLDYNEVNKKSLILDLINYNQYLLPNNQNNENLLKDTVRNYYIYKNGFKNLLNGLRTKDNHLKTSINKAINQYYKFSDLPLINTSIPDANRFNPELLSAYVQSVRDFSNAIGELKCNIKDHPFYGLNKNRLIKADYEELRKASIELTTYIGDIRILINLGITKYNFPRVTNLKELKALLNILAFADKYDGNPDWINNNDLDYYYDRLVEIKNNLNNLKEIYNELSNRFTRRIEFINRDVIDEAFTDKTQTKARNKIRNILGRKVTQSEINYVIETLKNYYLQIDINKEEFESIDESLSVYLKENKLDELRSKINLINEFKNNLKYIKEKPDFDIRGLLKNRHYDLRMLRRALQTIYNGILHNEEVVKNYFDESIFDFGIYPFDDFFNKMDKISKNFISINNYTNYYVELHNINKLVTNLGEELINTENESTDYENIFLKRFYKDFIVQSIQSNDVFKDMEKERLLSILENFSSSDDRRKTIINSLIIEYFNVYLHKNMASLKKEESGEIISLLKKGNTPLPLKKIIKLSSNTIFNLKPCVFTSFKSLSYLFEDSKEYDAILFLGTKDMTMSDVLPSLYRGKHIIVLSNEFEEKLEQKEEKVDTNNFFFNISSIYQEVPCSLDKEYLPLQGNFFDKYLKLSIYKKLKQHDFDVYMDKIIEGNSIDLIARVKNTKTSVAIIIDHLSYNSPETAYDIFNKEKAILHELGYFEFRIFPADYIINEDEKFQELVNYIIEKSDLVPKIQKKKSTVLLMDHLFPLFKDPHYIYYNLNNKNLKPLEKIKEMIDACAPISREELALIMKENVLDLAKKLVSSGEVKYDEGFYYIPDRKVTFRRLERSDETFRPLEYVSKKEIYDAVYKVVNYLSAISKDTLIKMILLSLGYKKINPSLYKEINADIEFLLEKNIIFIDDDILYKDLGIN